MLSKELKSNLVPRAFPSKTHFLREKPWGRGWLKSPLILLLLFLLLLDSGDSSNDDLFEDAVEYL